MDGPALPAVPQHRRAPDADPGPSPPAPPRHPGPPCRCRQAGSAPARVPAPELKRRQPHPPALSPRPAGGPGDPIATSGRARGAARGSTSIRHVAQRRPQHAALRSPRPALPSWKRAAAGSDPRLPARRWAGSALLPPGGRQELCCPLATGGVLDRDHWERPCPDRGSLLTKLHFKVPTQNPRRARRRRGGWGQGGGAPPLRDGEGWTVGRLGALGVGVVAARGVLSVRLPLPRAELHLPEARFLRETQTAQAGRGSHEAAAAPPPPARAHLR